MQTAAPSDAKLTRQTALPQLGLRPEATEKEVEAAYASAVAELELMSRNSRSEALSASYRRAREQIEKAYHVLKGTRNDPQSALPSEGDSEAHPATAASVASQTNASPPSGRTAVMRDAPLEASIDRPDGAPRASDVMQAIGGGERSAMPPGNLTDEIERARQETMHAREEVARLRETMAEARHETVKAREETALAREATASGHKLLEELRAASHSLREDVARVRDRLKSLSDEAEALRQTVSQLGANTARELEAIAEVRKRADGLLLSAQRNESEIATAAMHAEAYRDSAMYAAQAAERVLRALSAEAINS